jgi:pantothenate synthetase
MSSRNAYLSAEERSRALALSRALRSAREAAANGARTTAQIACAARMVLERTPGLEIEYVEAVDAETLKALDGFDRAVVVAIAARVGKTRLIDNAILTPAASNSEDLSLSRKSAR